MSKSLSEEYQKAVLEDLPDLWDRIEAALPDIETVPVQQIEEEKIQAEVKSDSSDGKTKKNNVLVFKKVLKIASIAAGVLVVLVPGVILLNNFSSKGTMKSADNAPCSAAEPSAMADEYLADSMLGDAAMFEEDIYYDETRSEETKESAMPSLYITYDDLSKTIGEKGKTGSFDVDLSEYFNNSGQSPIEILVNENEKTDSSNTSESQEHEGTLVASKVPVLVLDEYTDETIGRVVAFKILKDTETLAFQDFKDILYENEIFGAYYSSEDSLNLNSEMSADIYIVVKDGISYWKVELY